MADLPTAALYKEKNRHQKTKHGEATTNIKRERSINKQNSVESFGHIYCPEGKIGAVD